MPPYLCCLEKVLSETLQLALAHCKGEESGWKNNAKIKKRIAEISFVMIKFRWRFDGNLVILFVRDCAHNTSKLKFIQARPSEWNMRKMRNAKKIRCDCWVSLEVEWVIIRGLFRWVRIALQRRSWFSHLYFSREKWLFPFTDFFPQHIDDVSHQKRFHRLKLSAKSILPKFSSYTFM